MQSHTYCIVCLHRFAEKNAPAEAFVIPKMVYLLLWVYIMCYWIYVHTVSLDIRGRTTYLFLAWTAGHKPGIVDSGWRSVTSDNISFYSQRHQTPSAISPSAISSSTLASFVSGQFACDMPNLSSVIRKRKRGRSRFSGLKRRLMEVMPLMAH